VVVLSACSGHGFKFASVLGPIAATMVDGVNVHGDLAPFAIGRYSSPRR
jgi:N-methyl-L-tryptophan oxidase